MSFLGRLRQEILICDGAMGTMIQAAGLKPGACPELLNAEGPDIIRAIHRAYLDAGCDMVMTNTFGSSRIRLDDYRLGGRAAELCAKGARLARECAPEGRYVVGSVGPTGKLLEPFGTLSRDEALEAFREQIAALAQAGVDAICIETMMDLEEAALAIEAAKAVCSLPVMATMTFDFKGGKARTIMGTSPKEAARRLLAEGADVVGSNCGVGIHQIIGAIREMREEIKDAYLIAQPNAGLPRMEGSKVIYDQTPQELAGKVQDLIAAGANMVGGCCGTTPEHMKMVVKVVRGSI